MSRRDRPIKEGCLNRMIFLGERSQWTAINEFVEFYRLQRNYQGIGNRLIDPREEIGTTAGSVKCQDRLGGLLPYYYRKAA